MYHAHFGLQAAPFSIAPDPRFLYLSERHREALAHLLHGVGSGGGFILLTGEVGTGKTTLCRCLLEQLPENVRLAYVLNPRLSPVELLQTICDELRIAPPDNANSLKALTDAITERLIENHRRGLNTVLMLDEAQQLSTESLEQVRLLTNLETTEKKLLQIILIGQPELQELLARPELRQLAQRITARYHLLPLSLNETASYVLHRLQIAGVTRSPFTNAGLRALHRYSQGIPRLLNTISERALMGAYAKNRDTVSEAMVRKAAQETLGTLSFTRFRTRQYWPLLLLGLMISVSLASIFSFWLLSRHTGEAGLAVVTAAQDNTLVAVSGHGESAMTETEPVQMGVDIPANEAAKTQTNQQLAALPNLARDVSSGQANEDRKEKVAAIVLAEQPPDRRGDKSMHDLFALWHVDFVATRDGAYCDFAHTHELRCENGFADWTQLQIQNFPAVVTLQTEKRGPFQVLLRGLNEGRAVLWLGQREVELPKAEFERLWTGEYVLLWTAPFDFRKPLAEGSSGPAVVWIGNALAQSRGETVGSASARFDNTLLEQIKSFQRKLGLVPDGVVGMQTLLALSSRQNGNQPRLDGMLTP